MYQGAASPRGWATRCRYPPRPGPPQKFSYGGCILPFPSRGSHKVDSVTGAQLSGMDDMGNTVPLHHEVGPHVADISPPGPKTLLCCSHPHGLHARPGQQGGGGGSAAQGEMCMWVATDRVDEAEEASLAGPSMLESVLLPYPVEERGVSGVYHDDSWSA